MEKIKGMILENDTHAILWDFDGNEEKMVIPETVKEYGYVHRIQRSDNDPSECFIQDNYYYLCDAADGLVSQNLDEYEKKESYQLEYVEPSLAIQKNRSVKDSPYNRMMFEREARVLEMLISEGMVK